MFFDTDSEVSAKWKEVKRKLDRINELILKTKADLKKRPDNMESECKLAIKWFHENKMIVNPDKLQSHSTW